jgi:hypothetical protein
MDYLQTDQTIDGERVAAFWHSRTGKTALWARSDLGTVALNGETMLPAAEKGKYTCFYSNSR